MGWQESPNLTVYCITTLTSVGYKYTESSLSGLISFSVAKELLHLNLISYHYVMFFTLNRLQTQADVSPVSLYLLWNATFFSKPKSNASFYNSCIGPGIVYTNKSYHFTDKNFLNVNYKEIIQNMFMTHHLPPGERLLPFTPWTAFFLDLLQPTFLEFHPLLSIFHFSVMLFSSFSSDHYEDSQTFPIELLGGLSTLGI